MLLTVASCESGEKTKIKSCIPAKIKKKEKEISQN